MDFIPAVGMRMQRRRLPLGLLSRCSLFVGKRIDPPERRKEAISWKTHFPGVANVVKVIWFRFRISVARELPSSTRLGFVQTHHVCTILKSVMVISSLMNQLVMAHSIPIAADGNKGVSINTRHAHWFQLSSHGTYDGGKRQRAFSCLLPLICLAMLPIFSAQYDTD